MSTLSFHFHGYQPGDIVGLPEPDPLRPQRIEERHSPVVLRIGPDRIEGRNWTDAVLRSYGRMGSVLGRAAGAASIDIEPQTLTWLLERDPSAYREIVAAYDAGTAGFVMTSPFHPILPHLHRQERESLVANDLESLLANPHQAQRYEAIVQALRGGRVHVVQPTPVGDAPPSALVDYSSWSDYDDMMSGGITSDTRWTGLRRSDGLVVARVHRDRPLSQLWKHAFTLATERVETAIRRRALQVLQSAGVTGPTYVLRRLAVAYGRHWFREHFRAQGVAAHEADFARSAEEILGGKVDLEVAGFLARGYVLMLMGTRSDPRFWDNPDTRVTFQNVVLLSAALRDLAEASRLAADAGRATALRRLLQATFLEFSDWHARGEFAAFQSVLAWETSETAWYASLESEVWQLSPLDVMKRAALFALAPRGEWPGGEPMPSLDGVVAATGHIVGEAHGEWANPRWCEHRPG